MSRYGIYVFSFKNKSKIKEIQNRAEKTYTLKDSFGFNLVRNYVTTSAIDRYPDARFGKFELCIISLRENTLNYVAIGKRNGNAATLEFRVRFEDFVDLHSLNITDFTDEPRSLIENLLGYFKALSEKELNFLSPDVWNELLPAILKKRSNLAQVLIEVNTKRILANFSTSSSKYSVTAQEKDAVATSLDIFGGLAKRELISSWRPKDINNIEPAPFLQDLPKAVIPEDSVIIHDARVFGGWQQFERYCMGAAMFSKKDERLTIMNVNRHTIETCLGVDLLYYHHTYRSYILVQYKCMEATIDDFIYRPYNDKSYEREVTRMMLFENMVKQALEEPDFNEYRFNPEMFFFKLCPRVTFEPLATEIIEGMYLPFSYWKTLLKSLYAKGPRDGIRISKKELDRYINSSMFTELVQKGWVGSNMRATEAVTHVAREAVQGRISELITEASETGKSIILAVSSEINSKKKDKKKSRH